MRVFVTGATGFIGSEVVRDLLAAGHQVVGLARSDKSAAALEAAGAEVHRGELDDLDSLQRGAAAAEGVIHLAFSHDFTQYASAVAGDLRAVEAIGAVLTGSGKPFVIASGMTAVVPGRPATEEDAGVPGLPRVESETAVLALAERGVRSSIVRLPPSVHDTDHHGLIGLLSGIAAAKGVSAFAGDGSNRWPAVHQLNAARLFRLALESAPAGARLHAIGEEGIMFRDIAAAIGRRLNLPVAGLTAEEAESHFGWLARIISNDITASSALTQQRFGWNPVGPTLLEDLE